MGHSEGQSCLPAISIHRAGILVDEEFGADILRDAVARGYVTALSVEKSGYYEFDTEYGAGFVQHIRQFGPTFGRTSF